MTAVPTRPHATLTAPDVAAPAPAPAPKNHRPPRAAAPPRGFRPDIEGLRAVAVVLVVLYHADLGFPGGYVGVDVFFVVSGFLITRQLVQKVGRHGARALPTFYAHRVRRLLPAAVVVVAATVLAARIWAPALSVRDIALDALHTTFYGLNYRLAAVGTDYQHLGAAASPLQHFWSLGVEEQFYLVWPLLVVAILAVPRVAQSLLTLTVVAVVICSAYWSVTVTTQSAPWAYFSLHTRAWELGLGALVALGAARLAATPARLRGLAAAVGLVAIVAAAVVYDDTTPFPGTAAWVPVGGAALVVAAGCGTSVGVERVLGGPLMQCLGRASYSWYVWHWPMLVIAPMAVGHQLGWFERSAVVWLSLVAAMLSFFLVEEPARRAHLPDLRWLGAALGLSGAVAATAAVVIAFPPSLTGSGQAVTAARSEAASTTVPAPMQAALERGVEATAVPSNLTPGLDDAADSIPPTRDTGCHAEFTQVDQPACEFGARDGRRTAVLFGDSHMEQWLPAFDEAGRADAWRVVSWTKSACPVADIDIYNDVLRRTYTECAQWREATLDRIERLDPDVVIVSQAETVIPGSVSPEEYAGALASTLGDLRSRVRGEVRFLHDIPIPGDDSPACVAAHLDDIGSCVYDAEGAYSYPDRHAAIAPALSAAGVDVVATQPWFCTDEGCPPIVDNLLVYRDDSHMTVPYSRWLLPLSRSLLREPRAERAGAPAGRG